MPHKLIPGCLALLLILAPRANAQMDTVRPMTVFANNLLTEISGQRTNVQLVKNASFPRFAYFERDKLLYSLFFLKGFEKGWDAAQAKFTIDHAIKLQHCSTYALADVDKPVLPLAMSTRVQFDFNEGLQIDSFHEDAGINMQNVYCRFFLPIRNSYFSYLKLSDVEANIVLGRDTLQEGITLGIGFKGTLYCGGTRFEGASSQIEISGSTLAKLDLENNAFKSLYLHCFEDTFRYAIRVSNELTPDQQVHLGPDYGKRMDLVFRNCYFNGPIVVKKNAQMALVTFDHCSFGPEVSGIDVLADTVNFKDCSTLPSSLALQLTANRAACWLRLDHTNLEDAGFIYGLNNHLLFDSTVKADEYTHVYETLLSKFKKESEKESYQRLDIQYHHFLAEKGTALDRFADWANKKWWNYGYSKLRVIKWTCMLLAIFFVVNVLFWQGLQELYPIAPEYPFVDRSERPAGYRSLELLRIFLYTAFVFFSIKIDLDRLKVANPWLLAYFFFQWLVGLWCLFFIVNALLKIG